MVLDELKYCFTYLIILLTCVTSLAIPSNEPIGINSSSQEFDFVPLILNHVNNGRTRTTPSTHIDLNFIPKISKLIADEHNRLNEEINLSNSSLMTFWSRCKY